jgi:hypothetical protein
LIKLTEIKIFGTAGSGKKYTDDIYDMYSNNNISVKLEADLTRCPFREA